MLKVSDLSIIVVDDMEVSCRTVRAALNRSGYQDIRIAGDARQVLAMLQDRRADVVLADWIMPTMDGLELTDHIRQLDEETNRYTTVILFTAQEGVDPLVQAFQRGVDDYLTKPLNERALAARVHAAGRIAGLQNALLETTAALTQFNRQLEELATTDPLTGLGNRRYLETHLDALLTETEARGGTTCCVMIDLDHFKATNDQYGHDVGDEVLKSFATRLKRTVRPTDIVVRMGGEEFAVVMHYQDAQLNTGIFQRIIESIRQRPVTTSAGPVPVTASMGVCCSTRGAPLDRRELLKCADDKLYAAKKAGRDQVVH
ncbi:MAG: diguanylate cyclase response regulator [Chromatiales bacterium 21-64-14]|nr:MAG: diguanylate cyclase response regulator [Chromatiales bacterium 21-64-14]HQU14824.1 diguanylate cyclase [Gammaproteobacteria bacterium]